MKENTDWMLKEKDDEIARLKIQLWERSTEVDPSTYQEVWDELMKLWAYKEFHKEKEQLLTDSHHKDQERYLE